MSYISAILVANPSLKLTNFQMAKNFHDYWGGFLYRIESFLNRINIKSNRMVFAPCRSKIESNRKQFNLKALPHIIALKETHRKAGICVENTSHGLKSSNLNQVVNCSFSPICEADDTTNWRTAFWHRVHSDMGISLASYPSIDRCFLHKKKIVGCKCYAA